MRVILEPGGEGDHHRVPVPVSREPLDAATAVSQLRSIVRGAEGLSQ